LRIGKIESKLTEKIEERGCILAVLIDPFNQTTDEAVKIGLSAEKGGSDLILIGGSIGAGIKLDETIIELKKSVKIPIVLFPGNVDGVSKYADAILYMSLLNSSSPYWIIQAQALAAPKILMYNLEAIPTSYLIFEPGEKTAAGWVGMVNPVPREKSEIALAYALASMYLGKRWIYLEAGSGASAPVPLEAIKLIAKNTDLKIIVGGGLKDEVKIRKAVLAGANMIVVGAAVERSLDVKSMVSNFANTIKQASGERKI